MQRYTPVQNPVQHYALHGTPTPNRNGQEHKHARKGAYWLQTYWSQTMKARSAAALQRCAQCSVSRDEHAEEERKSNEIVYYFENGDIVQAVIIRAKCSRRPKTTVNAGLCEPKARVHNRHHDSTVTVHQFTVFVTQSHNGVNSTRLDVLRVSMRVSMANTINRCAHMNGALQRRGNRHRPKASTGK